MLGTYSSLVTILLAATLIGQGLLWLCGRRDWSWLAPALGLAVICAVAWGKINVGGDPLVGTIAIGVFALVALVVVPKVLPRKSAVLIVLGAGVLASLPFIVEGRFGILGTSVNPDMSQHLFAADRLADGGQERLASEGYPLGPHAVVVAVSALGPSLVEGFNGLTIAIAIAASLAPLALLDRVVVTWRRVAIGLLAGLTYMAASSLIQGSFKEMLQALFVLAFAIALAQLTVGSLGGRLPGARWSRFKFVPLAALAVGAIYAYSFPGLTWLAGTLGVFGLAALVVARGGLRPRALFAPAAIALGVFLAAVAPEAGRILDFGSFETFDPDGDGLGNLFNPISPVEALGIWPSGDFRLDAGAGFAPEVTFWLGAAIGLAALGFGLHWWLRRGEVAVPAALAAALVLYLYAATSGTPYQEAKAIVIAAPLATLIAARALLAEPHQGKPRITALAATYALAVAACSLLALVNGPVGPTSWGPGLLEFREQKQVGATVQALGEPEFLVDDRGRDLITWELRGSEVCVDEFGAALPPGATQVVTVVRDGAEPTPPYAGLREVRRSGDYVLWDVIDPERVPQSVCPFVADGDRAGSEP